MQLRKKIKKNALESLRNSWGKAVAILLFMAALALLFILLEQFFGALLRIDFRHGGGKLDLYRGRLEVGDAFAWMTGIFAFVPFVVLTPLHYGGREWYLHQIGGESPSLSVIFDCYRGGGRFFRSLLLKLAIGVRVAAVGALLFLPLAAVFLGIRYTDGYQSVEAVIARLLLIPLFFLMTLAACLFLFVFSLRYFLAGYFLVSTHKGVRECLRLSVRGMKGNLGEALSLYFSFLPWFLLSPLLIPLLFILPYMQASLAIYAKYLMAKLERNF